MTPEAKTPVETANSEPFGDGGPAFPRPGFDTAGTCTPFENDPQRGMSLVDWFAGQAIVAICSGRSHETLDPFDPHDEDDVRFLAEHAYAIAESLLEVRRERLLEGR